MLKYILVTGGELKNKGAQAMTFITVDQIARKYPDYKVVLFDNHKYDKEQLKNYKFEVFKYPQTKYLLNSLKFSKKKYTDGSRLSEIFNNAVGLIDISGYRLGSNWGFSILKVYIKMIFFAKHSGIPVYIMPQSFGPFDFKGRTAFLANFMINHYLPYAKYIMAREHEGMDLLIGKYKLKNVIKTPDLVLQNRGVDLNNVYIKVPPKYELSVLNESVAVIPNSKNNKYGDESQLLGLYKKLIDTLLSNGKNVYLIYHAVEDLKVCWRIKDDFYCDSDRVIVVEHELDCVEFGNCVSKFDFVIGSRYHSIVHSYKEHVPAIILGWAIKYRELAAFFQQEKYCFDVRNLNVTDEIISKTQYMCEHFKAESEKISAGMAEVQKENVYDYLNF